MLPLNLRKKFKANIVTSNQCRCIVGARQSRVASKAEVPCRLPPLSFPLPWPSIAPASPINQHDWRIGTHSSFHKINFSQQLEFLPWRGIKMVDQTRFFLFCSTAFQKGWCNSLTKFSENYVSDSNFFLQRRLLALPALSPSLSPTLTYHHQLSFPISCT